ncbi:carboxymethylenebutenolidase homolog isoform X2 [Serinus canaria]|uniref:carboxymethylenebutenolidase homolog isoform X2 n=1 Tax=Serinus canaria TaxID=9135 RepID=UPI0021CCEA59|nr:carboxymethylenebutenolidase homolog isoform X2 [Serinus canaria]
MADPFLYNTGERSHYGCLGHEVQIDYLKAYVCRPSFSTDKAVIVAHDVFGWQFPDIRYIVDLIAGHGYMEADVVLKYLKEQCGAKKIGIVGFSWGGMAVHHLMLKNPQLAAGVSLYGIVRDSEERYSLLNPTFFIFGEKDHTISLDQIFLLEDKLKQYCKVPYKIKVYPGQVHGFAQLKPEDMKPDDKPYIEEARRDMIDWIKMFV